jgi:DNA mismatch endonuclease (patch repair protein)
MTDVFSKAKRAMVMTAVRSKGNRSTEYELVTILRQYGVKGWRRQQRLPGKPDFTFWRQRVVVFVDGCFWHDCPIHGQCPASNKGYWLNKLTRNKARDRKINRLLRTKNWRVLRFWEHALRNPQKIAAKIQNELVFPKRTGSRFKKRRFDV